MLPKLHLVSSTFLTLAMFALAGCAGTTPPTPTLAGPTFSGLATPEPPARPTEAPAPLMALPPPATPVMAEQPRASPTPHPPPGASRIIDTARRQWRNGELAAALRSYRALAVNGQGPAEVLLELAQVEQASGEPGAARETLERLAVAASVEVVRKRAQLLLATTEIATGAWEPALRRVDVETAPDGLADLVLLRRAQAAAQGGNPAGARAELGRPELRQSTNRLILEQAGQLAERVGRPGLAAELYVQASRYPGWTAERSRLVKAAAGAFARAGETNRAIEQYRGLIEVYSWTSLGQLAGAELEGLGGLTAYHRGLLALSGRREEAARTAFAEAAASGADATAAASQLRRLEETTAWRAAANAGTAEAWRAFRMRYPSGGFAAEAAFQEGLGHYQAGRLAAALGPWDEAIASARGDDRARLLLWAGRALERLGRSVEARTRLEAATETRPVGYYAMRARDLLAGVRGWPAGGSALAVGRDGERAEGDRWVAGWSGAGQSVDVRADRRVERGFGLLALGLPAEAAAEFDGLIEESRNGRFLLQLAEVLAERELWSSATRAMGRLVGLSPARTIVDAPLAVQRLAYPAAYWDLVSREAGRRGLDPFLLLALMRQESRFDPFALSVAEARGLTQVIPSTGRGIAAALGRRDFTTDDLYRPAVAVEFGAWYLSTQLASFGGDPFRAVAAYNAGPGPIPRWAAADPDLFVERIDYAETKNYVRLVYVNHAMYRGLAVR